MKPCRPWHRIKSRMLKNRDAALRVNVGNGLAVSCVQASGVAKDAAKRWEMSPATAMAFARHAVHSIIYSSFAKGEERAVATITSPPCTLMVESGKVGESRGFADPPNGADALWKPENTSGVLSVMQYLTDSAVPHTSSVGFEGGIDQGWAAFYAESEQANVASLVGVESCDEGNVKWAGGLLVRTIAREGGHNGDDCANDSARVSLEMLRSSWLEPQMSIDHLQKTSMSGNSALEGLMSAVRELVADPVKLDAREVDAECVLQAYYCPCGLSDHAGKIIGLIPVNDIESLLKEQQTIEDGGIAVQCHMCNAKHVIPPSVLREKIKAKDQ